MMSNIFYNSENENENESESEQSTPLSPMTSNSCHSSGSEMSESESESETEGLGASLEGKGKQYSMESVKALHHIEDIKHIYENLLNEAENLHKDTDVNDYFAASKAKGKLAQLLGRIEKLQFNQLDAVTTAHLDSGKVEAKAHRRELNAALDELQEFVQSLYKKFDEVLPPPQSSPASCSTSLEASGSIRGEINLHDDTSVSSLDDTSVSNPAIDEMEASSSTDIEVDTHNIMNTDSGDDGDSDEDSSSETSEDDDIGNQEQDAVAKLKEQVHAISQARAAQEQELIQEQKRQFNAQKQRQEQLRNQQQRFYAQQLRAQQEAREQQQQYYAQKLREQQAREQQEYLYAQKLREQQCALDLRQRQLYAQRQREQQRRQQQYQRRYRSHNPLEESVFGSFFF